MNMKRMLLVVLAVVAVAAGIAYAVDTATVAGVGTWDTPAAGWDKTKLKVVTVSWTAAADGSKADVTLPAIRGAVVQVVTDPGSVAPADNYDIAILENGVDIMGGALNNRDTANTEQAVPLFMANSTTNAGPRGRFVYAPLTMTFTEQANANCTGVVYVYYTEQ